ncbi:MAG: hypothetical protein ACOCVI_01530 [Planctomycetota bacterium]
MRRRGIWTGLLVLLAASCAMAQEKPAIDRLDQGKLANQLQQMGMTELLEGLVASSGEAGSPSAKRLLARAKIARATTGSFEDSARRNQLVDEAIALLKDVVKATADVKGWREQLTYFRDRLDLAGAVGSIRIEPQTTALMYLYGTEADRRLVQKHANEAAVLVARLRADLQDKIDDLSGSGYTGLLRVRHFKQVDEEVKYRAGWVYFFDGMSDPNERSASGPLRRSIASLERYATGDADSGVKYWSLLVCGMARRELHQHSSAEEYLKSAAGEKAESPVRMQAAFEIGRNLAEWGKYLHHRSEVYGKQNLTGEAKQALVDAKKKFVAAEQAVEQFSELTAELLGKNKNARLQASIYATILRNYLYETWADAVRKSDPGEAKKIADKGLQAILKFLEEHEDPAVQQFLIDRIAGKYQGRTDYQNMPSIFVFSIALKELNKAEKLWEADKKDAAIKVYDKVTAMMGTIQDRSDKASASLSSRVSKVLAYIDYKLGRELDAARKNLKIARENPQAEDAFTAATNALKIYRKMVNKRPAPSTKREFIEALEFFLDAEKGAWAKKAPQWHFDLAWQLESLGDTLRGQAQETTYRRAVKAYENVPTSTPEYMQARYRGLSLQMKVIEQFGKGTVQAEQARKLIRSMQTFADEAKAAIADTDDEGKKKDMREWAARAMFESAILMSEVLNQDSRALNLMEQLPGDWPGTRVLRWAAAFRIERLMKTDRVKDAFEAFNEFRRKYGEEKARGLVQSLIKEVRDNIRELAKDKKNPRELAVYRDVYAQFAENLYKTSADESASKRYPLKQMYADALLEKGYAARAAKEDPDPYYKKALELYEELYAQDQKQVEARRAEIEKKFADMAGAVKAARGNVRTMLSLGKQYISEAEENEYTSISLTLLSDAVYDLDAAIDEDDIDEAMLAVQFRMKKFLEDYERWLKGRVPLDGTNILGLARSQRLLDDLAKARKNYEKWIRSAPRSHPRWWEVQYEYSRTFYELNKDSVKGLDELRTKIRQLQAISKTMGGEANRFRQLLRTVEGKLPG